MSLPRLSRLPLVLAFVFDNLRVFGQIRVEFEVGRDGHGVVNDALVPHEGREHGPNAFGN